MLNYHGCREEVINLISHYLIDIIYKIVAKAITFRKIVITPNRNKLMLQVIFIFCDLILSEQIIASFLSPLLSWEKQIFKKFYQEFWLVDWGMIQWFSKNVKNINWKIFPDMLEYTSQRKFRKHSGEIKPKGV